MLTRRLIVSFILWFVFMCVRAHHRYFSSSSSFSLLVHCSEYISWSYFHIDITFPLVLLVFVAFEFLLNSIEMNWIGYSLECQSFLRHCRCCCCIYYFDRLWRLTLLIYTIVAYLTIYFGILINSCECDFHLELTHEIFIAGNYNVYINIIVIIICTGRGLRATIRFPAIHTHTWTINNLTIWNFKISYTSSTTIHILILHEFIE